jgi:isoleucyl-tRNA synthetase
MFKPVSNKIDFPGVEKAVQAFWTAHDTFKKSLELRRHAPEFVFYDGPPFATGLPHYGHLLAGTIKDIVPRYQTMRGHYVERRFGWDCHGLPIEALAQEQLGLAGTGAIREAGVDKFNETCRSLVLKYVAEWRKTVTRMGRWVDFDNDYKTMDPAFMETIWWAFKQLWEQGRVYKSYRIMPYSWKLTTPLSNFEAGSNYQDVQDPAVTVRIKLKKPYQVFDPSNPVDFATLLPDEPCFALIWTTTPWTLPANLAVCAGPDLDYVAVRDAKEKVIYVLAAARLEAIYKKKEDYEVVAQFKGSELAGWKYEPMFPYLKDQPNAFQILTDGFVSTEDGTGLVHMAPAYGEDDFRVCKAAGIPPVDLLDENAAFTARVPDYAGQFCKDADKAIIRRLKDEKKLVHQSTIVHSYPFCERTDTPLIYRAIEAWYVRVEAMRDELVGNNAGVHWMPQAIGEKRFGNWLKEAKDWNISRNRFWGSCIPVWVAEGDKDNTICVGSIKELEELSGQKITDLHKHFVDKITIQRNGKTYRRTPEVLDCWFESGSMPYAQQHYPFENKAHFEKHFPADFIAEGLDQTRGWFYTLMVLSTALFKRPAFKNVVVNGLVLAEDGRKMSKRLKNYPDPNYMLDSYGADALRLYLINSPVVRAEDLRFSEEGVKQCMRDFLIPLWNAYSFFVTYANVDKWTPEKGTSVEGRVSSVDGDKTSSTRHPTPATRPLLDRWVLSCLDRLTQEVTAAMDDYDLQQAVRPFVHFIEDLTNWYIRRSRRRFWKSSDDADKAQAYATLYEVLLTLSKIAAPFVPFISEEIFRNLRTPELPESVHLCDFPKADGHRRDTKLEEQMAAVMTVVQLGRAIRAERNLKVRQPLAAVHVVCRDATKLSQLKELEDLIVDELNIKTVVFNHDETELVTLSAKPDFKKLGKRLGPKIKLAADLIAKWESDKLHALLQGEKVALELDGQTFEFSGEDLTIQRQPMAGLAVASEGDQVVALETELTPALVREGLARELVNRIQNLRKDADFEVTQRIRLQIAGDDELAATVNEYRDFIMAETLCADLALAANEAEPCDLNGHSAQLKLQPV